MNIMVDHFTRITEQLQIISYGVWAVTMVLFCHLIVAMRRNGR